MTVFEDLEMSVLRTVHEVTMREISIPIFEQGHWQPLNTFIYKWIISLFGTTIFSNSWRIFFQKNE